MRIFEILPHLMQHKVAFTSFLLTSAIGAAFFVGVPVDENTLRTKPLYTNADVENEEHVRDIEVLYEVKVKKNAPATDEYTQVTSTQETIILLPVLTEAFSVTEESEESVVAETLEETIHSEEILETDESAETTPPEATTAPVVTFPVPTETVAPVGTAPAPVESETETTLPPPTEAEPPTETTLPPPTESATGTGSYDNAFAFAVLDIVNTRRAEAGLPGLVWNEALAQSAGIRAPEIVINWSHTRPDGSPWYTAGAQLQMGENLAYGQTSADQVMNEWMASSSHAENILRTEYTQIGVSCYIENGTYYWVQHFA